MNSNILYLLVIPENCIYENHFLQICKEVADISKISFFMENDANYWSWDDTPKKVVYTHVTDLITVENLHKALNRPSCMDTLFKFFLIIPEKLFQFPYVRKFYKNVIGYFNPVYLNSYIDELQETLDVGEDATRIYHNYANTIVSNRMQTKPGFEDPLHVWEQAHTCFESSITAQLKQLHLAVDNLRACVELLDSQLEILEKQFN